MMVDGQKHKSSNPNHKPQRHLYKIPCYTIQIRINELSRTPVSSYLVE
jgi:hypothetical protein